MLHALQRVSNEMLVTPLNDDDVLSSTLFQYCWKSAVEIVLVISAPDIREKVC
jgi:hypothetical protein